MSPEQCGDCDHGAGMLMPAALRPWAALLLALAMLWQPGVAAAQSVRVEALLPGAAVLSIAGERKMLRVGDSHNGVALVAASATTATLEIGGERQEVGLSRHIDSNYAESEEQVVTIGRDARSQYSTTALINGHSVQAMVDTGANVVAMSSRHADALNIDYFSGQPAQVETAGGLRQAYGIKLQSVNVGGIEVHNIQASVVEGDFPVTVLLGMSYLSHVKMLEHNGILSLSRKR